MFIFVVVFPQAGLISLRVRNFYNKQDEYHLFYFEIHVTLAR